MSKDDGQDAQWVSLLADGELSAQDLGRAMAHLENAGNVHQTWDSYHLIGEVMRSGQVGARAHDSEFMQKLRQKLALENIKIVAIDAIPIRASGLNDVKTTSANDPWWRRFAGLASVALVGLLAWQGYVLMDGSASSRAPQLAQVGGSGAVLVAARPALPATAASLAVGGEQQAVMLRDPRLDALLAAHRQFGGTSALQMPSGFLRNATFDEGQR